jgi:hypothetical protein
VAGAGDVARGAGLRPTAKDVDEPPDPTVRAPALDPTAGRILGYERTFDVLVEVVGRKKD